MWHNKGSSLRFLGRKREALSCCEKALKINPSNARALFNKGALLSELGQLDDALKCLDQALDITPVDLYLISQIGGMLSMFESSNIKALCEKIVRLNLKPYDRDGLYNLGLCYLQLEDIDNALSLFLEAEKLDENDSGIWYELMNIYYKKQDADNTLKYCGKLIDAHKYFDEAVNKKSLVFFNTGKEQQAINLLKSVLAENDSFDYLWLQLSSIYEQVHNVNEALNAAEKCLQALNASKSKDSNKIAYVSKVIHDLSQKQANAGIPEIEQAIQNLKAAEIEYNKQKPHADAIRRLIQLYLNDGDKEKALHYCEMLIKTTNYITDFGNKAVVMSYFGDYAGAVGLLTDILKEWPHVDALWYVLSNIHEQHKNYSEALKAAIKCRDILLGKENPDRQNLTDVEQKIEGLRKRLDQRIVRDTYEEKPKDIANKEIACIKIANEYKLKAIQEKYRSDEREGVLGFIKKAATNRKIEKESLAIQTELSNIEMPEEKTLKALWNAYGPSTGKFRHSISFEDEIECLCRWLDVLHGQGMSAKCRVRERIEQKREQHADIYRRFSEGGGHVSLVEPVQSIIRELNNELPAYDG